jgi:hypothetical protein
VGRRLGEEVKLLLREIPQVLGRVAYPELKIK